MHDPNLLAVFTSQVPYHADALLQLAMVFAHTGQVLCHDMFFCFGTSYEAVQRVSHASPRRKNHVVQVGPGVVDGISLRERERESVFFFSLFTCAFYSYVLSSSIATDARRTAYLIGAPTQLFLL